MLFDGPKISPTRLFYIGGIIVALCGGIGFLGGVLAGGEVGFWAFVGLGAGVVVAAFMLGIVVLRNLDGDRGGTGGFS